MSVILLHEALLPLRLKYVAVCVVDAKVSERQTCEHNVRSHLHTTCEVKKVIFCQVQMTMIQKDDEYFFTGVELVNRVHGFLIFMRITSNVTDS